MMWLLKTYDTNHVTIQKEYTRRLPAYYWLRARIVFVHYYCVYLGLTYYRRLYAYSYVHFKKKQARTSLIQSLPATCGRNAHDHPRLCLRTELIVHDLCDVLDDNRPPLPVRQ